MKKFYCDLTKNPALWRRTYWAGFDANRADPEIIRNRDWLESEYGLLRRLRRPWNVALQSFDHTEVYRCDEGVLVLTSPYCECDEIMRDHHGFERTRPVYAPNAYSYVRVFKCISEVRRWVKDVCPEIW